jgi:hypothetical protein
LAKTLIMLVRVLGLAALILGALFWTRRPLYLGPHIGSGFLVATVLFVLAVIALTKGVVIQGILGVVFAVLLPVVGLRQLPLTFHTFSAIQIAHVILALAAIGVAESLYAAIRKVR